MSGSTFVNSAINFFALIKGVLIAAVLLVSVVIFVGAPLPISGQSMEPNFSSGQVVLVERLSYLSQDSIRRGDVVATRFPADPDKTKLIKRVVGLPGETIYGSEGVIFVNGQELNESGYDPTFGLPPYTELAAITLREDQYFLVGDNRPGSSDSRLWGPVQKQDIIGRAAFILWPLSNLQYINRPN